MRYVFIHGLGQSSASWKKTISYIGDEYDIECPDAQELLKGKETTYNNLYLAFSDYCQKEVGPICLCGLSLGAVLALNYALDQPHKVQSIILIGGQYKVPKVLLNLQNAVFQFIPLSSFKKLGFHKKDFIKLSKSLISLDFSERIGELPCPTLILYGEKDKANKRAAQEMAHLIKEAKLLTVKGAGHEVNVEAPEVLASIIKNYWFDNKEAKARIIGI